MADTPDSIIELTDIIEHGPGAKKKDGDEGGVDLSFERELEDLFADTPEDKAGESEEALPGLDGLELPEESPKDAGDIDLDGLDALLADADKADSPSMDLPELTDDFFDQAQADADARSPGLDEPLSFDAAMAGVADAAAGAAAGAVAASAVAGPGDHALEALTARLDLLEEKLSGMGQTLSDSFKAMLDEALAPLRDQTADQAGGQADPGPAIEELRHSLEERIDSLRAGLPEPLDEEALADRVTERVLASLPKAGEALDAGMVESIVDDKLRAFAAQLPEPGPSIDEEALVARAAEQALAAMPKPEGVILDAEAVEAVVDARLEIFQAGLPGHSEAAAPDLSGFATTQSLDALRQELLAEMDRAVPAAAARIIREEIQALVQDMD